MISQPTLSRHGRSMVLAVCCLSMVVVMMDVSIVNVALPDLRTQLGASVSELQWVVDAYTLVLASFLVMAGATADRIGRRRVFRVGLTVFGLASIACALAPGADALIAARIAQGFGASMLNPVAMAIVAASYPDIKERARAIGTFGGTAGVSLGLGPVFGGVLVDAFGWRAIFWINVPIIILGLVLTAIHVPESQGNGARRADPLGQVLVLVMLATLVFAVVEAPERGWTSPSVTGALTVFVVAVGAFLAYEPRRRDPLIELRLFRSIPFTSAILLALTGLCAFGAFLFVTTLYLQGIRHLSATAAGMCLIPAGLMIALLGPISGRLVARRGRLAPLLITAAAMVLTGIVLSFVSATTPLPVLLIPYTLAGVAVGTLNAPIGATAIEGMPRSMAGVAAALASVGRQVGTTLGIAIAGSVVSGSSPATGALSDGFVDASRPVWIIIAILGASIGAITLISSSRWADHTARRAAQQFAHDS